MRAGLVAFSLAQKSGRSGTEDCRTAQGVVGSVGSGVIWFNFCGIQEGGEGMRYALRWLENQAAAGSVVSTMVTFDGRRAAVIVPAGMPRRASVAVARAHSSAHWSCSSCQSRPSSS